MRGATGTWLTPRHACEAAVLLMAERVGACQQQHAAENTMVSHHSAETERRAYTYTHTHRGKHVLTLNDIQRESPTAYTATLSCQSSVETVDRVETARC